MNIVAPNVTMSYGGCSPWLGYGGALILPDPLNEGEMSEKVDIWMPLYIGDYLADTSHLAAAQHGCYLLWMMHYWRKGPLADDIQGLIRMGRLQGADAQKIARGLLQEFFTQGRDRLWHQKRLDYERTNWLVKKEAASLKAKKAAEARWEDAPSNAKSIAQALLEQCSLPSPLPGPLPKPLPRDGASRGKASRNGELTSLSSILSIMSPPKALPIPENKIAMIEAGYVFTNKKPCLTCGLELEWMVSPTGKNVPVLEETGKLHLGTCAAQAKAATQ